MASSEPTAASSTSMALACDFSATDSRRFTGGSVEGTLSCDTVGGAVVGRTATAVALLALAALPTASRRSYTAADTCIHRTTPSSSGGMTVRRGMVDTGARTSSSDRSMAGGRAGCTGFPTFAAMAQLTLAALVVVLAAVEALDPQLHPAQVLAKVIRANDPDGGQDIAVRVCLTPSRDNHAQPLVHACGLRVVVRTRPSHPTPSSTPCLCAMHCIMWRSGRRWQ